tara:strand:+ start:598 stop:846 length:249 start_codon:yes stop_codon:yes gene_type:complete
MTTRELFELRVREFAVLADDFGQKHNLNSIDMAGISGGLAAAAIIHIGKEHPNKAIESLNHIIDKLEIVRQEIIRGTAQEGG